MATTIQNIKKPIIQMHALRGKFTGVTYFMTSLSLSEVADQLHFATTETATSFDERVQRRINKKRAVTELFEQYLKQPGVRFFNSLVVVLTPKEGTDTGYYEFHPFKGSDGTPVGDVGMLEVLSDIDRIVVDGQHRLQALKKADEYCRDPSYNTKLQLKEMKIPVVFLTFDELKGSDSIEARVPNLPKKVAERSRRVFIDLNKNAKGVDKNTLLILDDYDFSAVAARYLIEQDEQLELYTKWAELGGRGGTLGDRDPHFTNLQLLDEYVERIFTFDTGVFIEGYGEVKNLTEMIENKYPLYDTGERKEAINQYFLKKLSFRDGLIPAQMIRDFFGRVDFFDTWKTRINEILGGDPKKQPISEENDYKNAEKRAFSELHKEHLLSTVAGQRTAFLALLIAYPHFTNENEETNWHHALEKLAIIQRKGWYSRTNGLWRDLLVRQGNRMRVNAVEQSSWVLSHLIRCAPVEDAMEKVDPEEGYGTGDTKAHYLSALESLG